MTWGIVYRNEKVRVSELKEKYANIKVVASEIDIEYISGKKKSLRFLQPEETKKIFEGLKENAEILLPPTEIFYTFHAALIDKFGVAWNIVAEESPNL